VIGNPPYEPAIQLKKTLSEEVRAYLKERFKETNKGAVDIYILFFNQALKVAREGGVVALITPNKYLSAPYADAFRRWVEDEHTLLRLIDLSQVRVFEDPAVYPVITLIQKGKALRAPAIVIERQLSQVLGNRKAFTVSRSTLKKLPQSLWGPLLSGNIDVLERIIEPSVELESVAVVQATSTTAEADAYSPLIGEGRGHKIINTGTIDRYCTTYGKTPLRDKRRSFARPTLDIKNLIVSAGRRKLYESPKIVFAKLALRPEAFLDFDGSFASINTNCVHSPHEGFPLPYLEAVLNSKLMSFVYGELFQGLRMSKGYFQFQAPQLRHLPIVRPTANQAETLAGLVLEMHRLQGELIALPSKKTEAGVRLSEKVSKIDREIDDEVYRVYGLRKADVVRIEG
jgi:adenine-specific DNA-methyltransferase